MNSSLENPFRNPAQRAKKRLFKAGQEKLPKLNIKDREKLEKAKEFIKVKYGPYNIFYPQVQFLKKLEKLVRQELEVKTANSKLSGRAVREYLFGLSHIDVDQGNITSLFFSGLTISKLPKEIANLKELRHLSCYTCNLTELPAEIGQLISLRRLEVSHNNLWEIPREIGQLKNLERFDFSSNQIKEIPKELFSLKNLNALICSKNAIRKLPVQIKKLINLQVLGLDDCSLEGLPPEICELRQLENLIIKFNDLTTLPAQIGKLKNLHLLDAQINFISPTEQAKIKNNLPTDCDIKF